MKKITFLFIVTLLPLMSNAQTLIDGVYYNLIAKAKLAEVTSGDTKYTGSVTIPESFTYNGVTYSVTSIGAYAFSYCSGLTSVTIGNSVTSIGNDAFLGCSGLTSVTIGNSVTSIGGNAFAGCSGLTSVTIPNSVTSIGDYAFSGCSVTSVTIPNSVTSIGGGAFAGCSGLTKVTLNSNAIASKSYSSGSTLGSIFGNQVNEYVLGDDVTSIGSDAFYKCSGLTSITIPNSVMSIGNSAFQNCSGLTSITIPNSVTSIGRVAFECENLTTIVSLIENPFVIFDNSSNDRTFSQNAYVNATLYVPKGKMEAYKATEGWKDFMNIVEGTPAEESDIIINEENFPDKNFRSWLLSQSYGSDGVLTEEEIAGVSKISVFGESIQSLKGIEYFTALTHLECSFNPLTSLDVSKNIALTFLYCRDNKLTSLDVSKNTSLTGLSCNGNQLISLDVSKNTALTGLSCYNNQLTSLDVSKNTVLKSLYCSSNQLTSLDVSKNTALTELWCTGNQLTSLDLSKNTVLTELSCSSNQLTSLDVSKNTELYDLSCDANQLTSLDVSKNTVLKSLYCYSNQLTSLDLSGCTALTQLYCHQNRIKGDGMDALITSLPLVSNRTMYVIYNENEQNVMTSTQVAAAKAKGWIPQYFDGFDWYEYAGSDPSGIQGIMLDKKVNAPIYDLNGRRLTEPQKGINIIGGKKVFVK